MADFGTPKVVLLLAAVSGAGGFVLGRSSKRVPGVEREVTGATNDETGLTEDRAIQRYRAAVGKAWVDGKLSEAEAERLGVLQSELGLSQDKAGDIEREVMDDLKEDVITYEDSIGQSDGLDRYRIAVEMAWANRTLDPAEERQLGRLERGLDISGGEAEEIEREVMGGPRKEIVTRNLVEDDRDEEDSLDNERWVDLAEECVDMVDELDRTMARFDPEKQELADHVIWRLAEVLERSGVELISDDTAFDSKRHKPEKATSRTASGATISEILTPGFAVGRRVLRRARVRVE